MIDNGADRIFVDLEIMGKFERQGHLNTVISRHDISDVEAVRAAIPGKDLMVRLNPFHEGSNAEIDSAIEAGADVLMLPMFRTMAEVSAFAELIAGRCRLCLLLETKEGMEIVEDAAGLDGVDEVHIGLNDLSLDLGLSFMFQPFALGLVDDIAKKLCKVGKPFGIGGLARSDEGLLPARVLIGEHVRLGSSAAILSRTFHRQLDSADAIRNEMNFAKEVAILKEIEADFRKATPGELEANRIETCRRIAEISRKRTAAIH